MRFSTAAAAFAQAASTAVKGTDTKAGIPILQNLLVEATADGALTIIGTDGDRRIAASCDAEVDEPGEITVDGRLARWLAALDPAVSVKAALTDGRLHVRSGRSSARIATLAPSDFPIFPGPGAPDSEGQCHPFTELDLSPEQRHNLFVVPAPAISDETTRYYLNGVYLHADNDENLLIAVATNGHVLIRTAVSVAAVNGILRSPGVIVPGPAAAAISKLSGPIRIDHRSIEAKGDRQIYSSKLIDATYPDYRRTIPGPSNRFAAVNRGELINALKRLEVLRENTTTGAIRFEWAGDGLCLSLPNRDAGSDQLDAETGGEAIAFGLSAKLMASALGSLSGDLVKIEAADPSSPVRLSAPGDDATTLAIIMPMRI